ncbi:MAG TPA: DUF1638 domain-containing protein [Candidatus Acidoferrales bacterium]|nr:DUF1638 domain-containing protein [Candidatus Acidoferrales bacterium]
MIPPDEQSRDRHPPRLALLACSVFEREIAHHAVGADHILQSRFFEVGLHDRPERLRGILQENLEAVDAFAGIDAVVLAYGLCGRGTAGLRPLHHPLVIPRAHDCITVFMGSKETFAAHQRRCPACHYYTPGWNRARRVPGPDRLAALKVEFSKKFDADAVEFLIETEREQWALHNTATYLDLGTEEAETEALYARRCAAWLGWKFERIHGDAKLLRDLIWGNWDEQRFQIIDAGMQLGHAPDQSIFRIQPAAATAPL